MTLRELDIKWGPIEFSSCTENGEDMKQFFREFRVALFSECLKKHLISKCSLGHYNIYGEILDKHGNSVYYCISDVRTHTRLYPFKVMYRKDNKSPNQWCCLADLPSKAREYIKKECVSC